MTQEEKDKLVESRKKRLSDFWMNSQKIKETPLIGYDEPDYDLSIGKGKKED